MDISSIVLKGQIMSDTGTSSLGQSVPPTDFQPVYV